MFSCRVLVKINTLSCWLFMLTYLMCTCRVLVKINTVSCLGIMQLAYNVNLSIIIRLLCRCAAVPAHEAYIC